MHNLKRGILILIFVGGVSYYLYSKHLQRLNESSPEFKCRMILQRLFKKRFKSIRPDWLRNPKTSRNLELDCYNEELGLAVEYNGEQHYKFVSKFHKSQEDFEDQIFRDKFKKSKCKSRNIKLIVVPYNVENIEEFIIQKYRKYKNEQKSKC